MHIVPPLSNWLQVGRRHWQVKSQQHHIQYISTSLYNVYNAGQMLPVCSCVLKRCGLTRAAVVFERAFTEGRGRWGGWGGQRSRVRRMMPPWGGEGPDRCLLGLASSTPHHTPPQTPRERSQRNTYLPLGNSCGTAGGWTLLSPACTRTSTHTRTHCKNTT